MLGRQHGVATPHRKRHFLRALAVGLLASLFALHTQAQPSHAQDGGKVLAEVLVVLASGEDGSVDPSLSHVRALKHPPFNEYKTLKLLSRSSLALPKDQAVELPLPNGRTLVLRLVARLPDGRAKVQLSISRPNRKDYLPLLEVIASTGEPFFVAGQRYEGGTLVLGIRAGEGLKPLAQ
jgi:hypothetical protein